MSKALRRHWLKHHMTHSDNALLDGKIAAPGAARLAAESAFSGVTETAPAASGRPVIIVRRKKHSVDGKHDDSSNDDDHQHGATREPRSTGVDSGPVEEPKESAADAAAP